MHYPGNQVGALQEFSLSRGLGDPVYTAGEARGPPHRRVFTITCQVAEVKSTREGSTKKEAKVIMSIVCFCCDHIIQRRRLTTNFRCLLKFFSGKVVDRHLYKISSLKILRSECRVSAPGRGLRVGRSADCWRGSP